MLLVDMFMAIFSRKQYIAYWVNRKDVFLRDSLLPRKVYMPYIE